MLITLFLDNAICRPTSFYLIPISTIFAFAFHFLLIFPLCSIEVNWTSDYTFAIVFFLQFYMVK